MSIVKSNIKKIITFIIEDCKNIADADTAYLKWQNSQGKTDKKEIKYFFKIFILIKSENAAKRETYIMGVLR